MAGRLPKHLLRRPSSVVVGDLPTCAAIQRGNNCWLANECPQNEVAKVLLRARRKSFSVPWPMYKPRRTRLVALIDHPERARLHLSANKRPFEGSAAPPASRGAPKTPLRHLRLSGLQVVQSRYTIELTLQPTSTLLLRFTSPTCARTVARASWTSSSASSSAPA